MAIDRGYGDRSTFLEGKHYCDFLPIDSELSISSNSCKQLEFIHLPNVNRRIISSIALLEMVIKLSSHMININESRSC